MDIKKQVRTFGGTLTFWSHDSDVTKTPMAFSTFVPDDVVRKKAPGLVWLSGLTCTEENFVVKAGALRDAASRGLVLICPDTSPRGLDLPGEHDHWDFGSGAGFYINATQSPWKDHYRMEDYVVNELIEKVAAKIPVDAGKLGIFGHSMGGYGALALGMKYPKKFRSISAFSPICSPINCPWGQKAFGNYLGPDQAGWVQHDPCELIKSSGYRGKILVDQGMADDFLGEQLKPELLEEAAKSSEIEVIMRRHKGYDHSYYFIATFVSDHLAFHHEVLA